MTPRDPHVAMLLRCAMLAFAWAPATNMYDVAAYILWSPSSRLALLARLTGYGPEIGHLLIGCAGLLVALPAWNVLVPWRPVRHTAIATAASVALMLGATLWVAMVFLSRGTDLDVARHTLLRAALENVIYALIAGVAVNAQQRHDAGVIDSDFGDSNLLVLREGEGRYAPR